MPHICHFTGIKSRSGWTKAEKGARRDGGVGNKIKGRTKRMVKPNLQKVRCIVDGETVSIYASTRAIKRGLVVKPYRVPAKVKAKA
jgi:large subunit ribosomal protein L28